MIPWSLVPGNPIFEGSSHLWEATTHDDTTSITHEAQGHYCTSCQLLCKHQHDGPDGPSSAIMRFPLRPITASSFVVPLRPLLVHRSYATNPSPGASKPTSRRRAVTPFNDTGFVPWSELSVAEKASRATQQSFNFGLVVVGLVLTGGVGYFIYTDVFSPDSKTAYFNRAVDRIKKDQDCLAALGDANKIIAHGDETANKWRRARPIASTLNTDARGNDHLVMQFYVEGPLNNGAVHVHLVKRAGHSEFEYKYLFVDVKGHQRIYLENADEKALADHKKFRLFGVNWG
ncbi:TIM21-domain-containing protein [Astrocystis sublimbata]|nr:TIM21-domain-containing protein [Astrocystis sublimbata]